MRLISQSGMWDIPYERVTIAVDPQCPRIIKACDNINANIYINLATYDSPTKAKHVIEIMREAYKNGEAYFRFP